MLASIAELPFRERPALELLHLDEHRDAPDADYAGYGWCRVPAIELVGAGGRLVTDALLVAVHSCDDGEAMADDVELEFELGPGAGSVTVLLSAFLDRWLPRLRGGERAIVLVACNPHRATLRRPAAAGDLPVHYALGDVESWIEDGRLQLVAPTWCTT